MIDIKILISKLEELNKEFDNFKENRKSLEKIHQASIEISKSWSGSWIGFHSNLYFKGLIAPPRWEYKFDSEWGSVNGIPDYWIEYTYDQIKSAILNLVPIESYTDLVQETIELKKKYQDFNAYLIAELSILDAYESLIKEIEELEAFKKYIWEISPNEIIQINRPNQVISRDSVAMHQGIVTPPHMIIAAEVLSAISRLDSVAKYSKEIKLLLRKIELRLSLEKPKDDSANTMVCLNSINQICKNFHSIARQMRTRYNNRTTIEINDEYDVQDLFHALLRLFFDDIRNEEWNPSYAGGSSRSDFILKNEKFVIEIKKTRSGLTDRKLGEQLIVDIVKYKQHPDCKTLVNFVYDPEGRIGNPTGIENDLNDLSDENMNVITYIYPK